jgi:pimeloyl-ACP methyl ester carboxylesterase
MATNVLMPKWGMTMEQGQVNSWLKKEGEPVEQGEALVEVESSKATEYVEAPASGILARILVTEGQTVPITTVIAVIAARDESIPQDKNVANETPGVRQEATGQVLSSQPAPRACQPASLASRVAASPAARRLARERRVDLSSLKGTGPDGMIVVEDVEAALQSVPPVATPISKVVFYSQGHKLDGIFYLPKDYQAGKCVPGIIICPGFTYLKDLLLPEMARQLSAQGYACLLFDYRGFGKSEGQRGRLLPLEQVTDVRAAVTYLVARPEVDTRRIGLVGISLGASHALYATAQDERVGAVAAIAPLGDGRRWLRGSRRYWEWAEFLARIEADRTARALGGQGELVDAWDIVAPDPASRTFLEAALRAFPALKCDLSLETAEALIDYCPESLVGRISPRPVLILHGEGDLLVPVDEARSLFARAAEPRQMVLLPGMSHFDWAQPHDERFHRVMDTISGWLSDYVKTDSKAGSAS